MILGFQAEEINVENESTVFIDTEKFFKIFKNLSQTNDCSENEVFQGCGDKCILSCRFASSALRITLSKEECNKTECIKGCFCRDDFVRHGDKCIAATECSARKQRSDKMLSSQPTMYKEPLFLPFQPFNQQQFQPFQPFQPFGLIKQIFQKPPGCGLSGCPPVPPNIHIHNHNEAVNGKYFFILIKKKKMFIKDKKCGKKLIIKCFRFKEDSKEDQKCHGSNCGKRIAP